jgi:mannose-1-phosphate guanylyltransferase/mannose-6-phosphate isomerase
MDNKLRPILLAGGSGSRLWPLSTEDKPKQFIPIFKEFSLFDLSLQRLNKNSLFKKPIIVTSDKYIQYVNDSLLRTGIEAEKIILEPEAKNTFPAITMAVILGLKKNSSENFFIAPSDHYISLNKKFYDSCIQAESSMRNTGLILMGIKPEHPSIEYGYISSRTSKNAVKTVNSFIEKPDIESSRALIKKSDVYWNSGMFLFNGKWFVDELNKLDKKMFLNVSSALKAGSFIGNIFAPDKKLFKKIKKYSFDKGFVEKISDISMVILDAGWSDLGSWASLGALHKDPNSDMTLYSKGAYSRVEKPWGYFETLMENNLSKLKLLSVFPGGKLSLQRHERRMETWYVIQGEAKVTKGVQKLILHTGESVSIEKNQLHRLENETDNSLKVIEVQSGSYFGEDDIIRVQDTYGRAGLH